MSGLARRSLLDISRFIAQAAGSRSVAERFVGQLRSKCEQLASLPGLLGRLRPDLGEDIRSLHFRNYVIVFRYTATTLDIIDIVHAHRDTDAYRGDDGPR